MGDRKFPCGTIITVDGNCPCSFCSVERVVDQVMRVMRGGGAADKSSTQPPQPKFRRLRSSTDLGTLSNRLFDERATIPKIPAAQPERGECPEHEAEETIPATVPNFDYLANKDEERIPATIPSGDYPENKDEATTPATIPRGAYPENQDDATAPATILTISDEDEATIPTIISDSERCSDRT